MLTSRRQQCGASRGTAAILLSCVAGLSPSLAVAADGDGWEWSVTPYAWAVNLDADMQWDRSPGGGIDAGARFDDVLDEFDGAFEVHLEGRGDRYGVFADFTYLGLAGERERPGLRIESDLDARLVEVAGVWRAVAQGQSGLDVFAGVRLIDLDLAVSLDPQDPAFDTVAAQAGDTFNDVMVGARYVWPSSGRWHVVLRADGSFGQTEGTWNASVMANYRMQRGAWLVGYRHLSGELQAGGATTDITATGPVVGYSFFF